MTWSDDLIPPKVIRRSHSALSPGSFPRMSPQAMERMSEKRNEKLQGEKRVCCGENCSTILACDNGDEYCVFCTRTQVLAPVLALGNISAEEYDALLNSWTKARDLKLV